MFVKQAMNQSAYLESHDFSVSILVDLVMGIFLQFLLNEPQQMFLVEAGRSVYVCVDLVREGVTHRI